MSGCVPGHRGKLECALEYLERVHAFGRASARGTPFPGAGDHLGRDRQSPTTVDLTWLAVGGDACGKAARYQLRVSPDSIDLGSWAHLDTLPGLPAPGESGASESFHWTAAAGTTWHVALRVFDANGNESLLSNE